MLNIYKKIYFIYIYKKIKKKKKCLFKIEILLQHILFKMLRSEMLSFFFKDTVLVKTCIVRKISILKCCSF